MNIGILTSGGDSPGMNAAIRAIFRAAKMRDPNVGIQFFRDGYRGLAARLEASTDHDVDRSAVRDIIHRGGTFLGSGRLPGMRAPDADDPNFEAKQRICEDLLRTASVNLHQLDVSTLVVIGGDGSYRGATSIAAAYRERHPNTPFRIIGLPGTIDNDVYGSEYSIGYDTARNNIVDAIRKLRDTVDSHQRCIILEVMGNTSGWLALESAIAGGAAVVAIPEIASSQDHERILERLRAGVRKKYRYFIIVVAEGVLKRAGDTWSTDLMNRIQTDPLIHDTDGEPMQVRVNSVGHIARGGQPSSLDNTLASRLGAAAAELAQLGTVNGVAYDGDMALGVLGHSVRALPLSEVVAQSPHVVEETDPAWTLAEQMMLQPTQPF